MKLNNKIILSLVVFGVAACGLFVLVIFPLFQDIKTKSEGLILQKERLAEFERKIKNIKEFQAFYREHQVDLEKINALFLNSEMPVDFIEFLEGEAENSRLKIKISSSGISHGAAADFWPSLNFQVTLSGPSSNFLNFLEKLESGPYLIEVVNLNLSKPSKKEFIGGEAGDISANFSIKVYTK